MSSFPYHGRIRERSIRLRKRIPQRGRLQVLDNRRGPHAKSQRSQNGDERDEEGDGSEQELVVGACERHGCGASYVRICGEGAGSGVIASTARVYWSTQAVRDSCSVRASEALVIVAPLQPALPSTLTSCLTVSAIIAEVCRFRNGREFTPSLHFAALLTRFTFEEPHVMMSKMGVVDLITC